MDLAGALAYLDDHVNLEAATGRVAPPSLDRMRRLVDLLGDPQLAVPVIHLTGTNGKGSTGRILSRLLEAHGLSVGLYSSPHLERVNERIARNGEPIADDDLVAAIGAVALVEPLAGVRPTYFEILTAAGFWWFAEAPVDVAVLEVGLLGRWDATNVADGRVAVVTNVELDHTEYAGPTRADIAREKAGIVKPGATLVQGETDPELAALLRSEARAAGASAVWERGPDFDCVDSRVAVGGRMLDLRTPAASYTEQFLPLHGAHQGDNAAAALAAAEAFFGRALDPDLIAGGFAEVTVPGRFEVVHRHPLVVLDGAHNPAGAEVAAGVLEEDFGADDNRVLVVGMLAGRDPEAMLSALDAASARMVVACTPRSPRALPAAAVGAAARALGAERVIVHDDVGRAVAAALDEAAEDDVVLVTGSLYVVGEARRLFPGRR
ncbi:MAG: bifunctional folylpolyglutamate synthase/dihydrofolate synthase [Acidimicrobiales bacterium]|nr:bifunctional folylpolyglutamate synthase/dihydrofolate synthase [Acidimicrobiales bacterium]